MYILKRASWSLETGPMILGDYDQVKFYREELCCISKGRASGGTYFNTMGSLQAIPDFEVLKEPRGLLRLAFTDAQDFNL